MNGIRTQFTPELAPVVGWTPPEIHTARFTVTLGSARILAAEKLAAAAKLGRK
jgi:hypothetical protein